MESKFVDIKSGKFQIFGSNELIEILEGVITNVFVRKGNVDQLQYIIEGNCTYKLQVYVNSTYLLDMNRVLLNYKRGEKVYLKLIENGQYFDLKAV